MTAPPTHEIDPASFAADPYPALAEMRARGPVVYVPQLDAMLLTRRDDIHHYEKQVALLSSDQPGGLMTVLMGQNLMRRDGAVHQAQRKALFPALSPRTVAQHWKPIFEAACLRILADLSPRGACDLVRDFAMPVSAEALRAITGLTSLSNAEMDAVSQAMIDGCANYAGDAEVEARCHTATALIDAHIMQNWDAPAPHSALAVQQAAGLSEADLRANIKLVISGGQNEPRDAIAGAAGVLLAHHDAVQDVMQGRADWGAVFAEYVRLHSPIGMSPRRAAQSFEIGGYTVPQEARVFLMFSAAGRDPAHFEAPDRFDMQRDTGPSIPFGAGPHFCAGAAASRCLVTEIALPLLFATLPGLRLDGEVTLHGWAFRGPKAVPVRWTS